MPGKTLRGNILPLALVMTVAILLGGVTLGLIIVQGLQRAARTDDSTISYYVADAGIEKQLFEVRKNNANIEDLGTMGGTFSNGGEWESADASRFVTTDEKVFSELNNGDFQFVDLFDPDAPKAAAGITRVNWTWDGDGSAFCQVEMGYAEWTSGMSILPTEYKLVFGNSESATQALSSSNAYRLRFTARNCDVTNLRIQVYDDSGSGVPVSFPGDITIASEGIFRATKQAIAVTMPRLDILSGIFRYVIFTECTLLKDSSGSSSVCP